MRMWDVLYINGEGENAIAQVITVEAETWAGATARGQQICNELCNVLGGGPRLVVDVKPPGQLCKHAGKPAIELGY